MSPTGFVVVVALIVLAFAVLFIGKAVMNYQLKQTNRMQGK